METAHNLLPVLAGVFIGGLCGLLPLMVGHRRNRDRIGIAGFVICLISGGFLGTFVLPVPILFTALILILGKPKPLA